MCRPPGGERRRRDTRLLHAPHGRERGDAVGPRHLRDDGELLACGRPGRRGGAAGAARGGGVTYERREGAGPAVARGDEEAPPAMREWAVTLEAKPKYVVSSTRKDFPWTNSHHIAGDLRPGGQKGKAAT